MEDGGPGLEEEYLHAVFTILSYVYSFSISDYMPRWRGLDLDSHEKIMKEVNTIIDKYHDLVIEERIGQWACTGSLKKEPEDLLDNLITIKDAYGNPLLTSDEIKA